MGLLPSADYAFFLEDRRSGGGGHQGQDDDEGEGGAGETATQSSSVIAGSTPGALARAVQTERRARAHAWVQWARQELARAAKHAARQRATRAARLRREGAWALEVGSHRYLTGGTFLSCLVATGML